MVKVHGQKNLHKNKYECIRKSSDVHKASRTLFCYCLQCKHVLGHAQEMVLFFHTWGLGRGHRPSGLAAEVTC